MADVDWESVEAVNVKPGFVPPVSYWSSNSVASMGWDIIVPTLYIQTSIYVFYCRQLIMLHVFSTFLSVVLITPNEMSSWKQNCT